LTTVTALKKWAHTYYKTRYELSLVSKRSRKNENKMLELPFGRDA
jgi:hypothetical protein